MGKEHRTTRLIIIATLIIANLAIIRPIPTLLDQDTALKVYFLDVGQGDAILIETPDNNYGLIDGGKGNIVLEEIAEVLPAGIHSLEFVLYTHADADHIEGLIEVQRRFNIKYVFIHQTKKESPIFDTVKAELENTDVIQMSLFENHDFTLDDVLFNVVWPIDSHTFPEDENARSISLVLEYADQKIFLGGDLDAEYEDEIASLIGDISILKLSHHGSKTSSSEYFLDQVAPEHAIASAGKDNSYGHPHPDVVDRVKKRDITLYSTAEDGKITVSIDETGRYTVSGEK